MASKKTIKDKTQEIRENCDEIDAEVDCDEIDAEVDDRSANLRGDPKVSLL